jgi:hypothetical protein
MGIANGLIMGNALQRGMGSAKTGRDMGSASGHPGYVRCADTLGGGD